MFRNGGNWIIRKQAGKDSPVYRPVGGVFFKGRKAKGSGKVYLRLDSDYVAQEALFNGQYAIDTYKNSDAKFNAEAQLNAHQPMSSKFDGQSSLFIYKEFAAKFSAQAALNASLPLDGKFNSQTKIFTYKNAESKFNGQQTLNAYIGQLSRFNGQQSLYAGYISQDGKFSAQAALNAFISQTGRFNAQSSLLTYASSQSVFNAQAALSIYTSTQANFTGQQKLAAHVSQLGKFNSQASIYTYSASTAKFNSQSKLLAYVAALAAFNGQQSIFAYSVNQANFNSQSKLLAYTAVEGQFNAQAALLAYEKFYAWAMNITTGAISKYEAYNFYTLSGGLGANGSGLYTLSGSNDGGNPISAFIQTGKTDFKDARLKRITDYYIGMEGGELDLTVAAENGEITYRTSETTQMETDKLNLARGAKGRYWQFKLANVLGSSATVDDQSLEIETLSRKI